MTTPAGQEVSGYISDNLMEEIVKLSWADEDIIRQAKYYTAQEQEFEAQMIAHTELSFEEDLSCQPPTK